jgi:gliding motility-associated-like protein
LAEFKAKDFDGWDGKYNGEDMPSTDYWYIIELRETGKRMVGHFLLRR